MLIHIVARGRIGRSPEADLVARYLKRVTWPTKVTELPDQGGKIPAREANSRLVLLDEKGKDMPSTDFAALVGHWREDGVREARFMIGAADGFDDSDRAEADLLLSFGKLTWPHMMARAMLAEQLWRAASILANHPYHREG
ncbi:23S rRNA (pseudouridine(1915)-N(3))-methyltransferase RlmH [Stakelama marina]|uniref:Ribosomal RNA large subunit methyltransferase H n=1 Tax=Stakelama marina TaxID=2826939 RepID=A0A8T4IIJ7_9SPHN|nr:23S rRNA (pseudouridine(1915)-N(3))-methyltransferase RlmH [Stakelama marina]MBR0552925.1 23S rRNA (pseudouridine(1915)-N(3))-methyltransferase RlmH [Stakelama marina]